jgi:hypothetical protein
MATFVGVLPQPGGLHNVEKFCRFASGSKLDRRRKFGLAVAQPASFKPNRKYAGRSGIRRLAGR